MTEREPTCPWCGSEMRPEKDDIAYCPPTCWIALCTKCGACGPPGASAEAALAAARVPMSAEERAVVEAAMAFAPHARGMADLVENEFGGDWEISEEEEDVALRAYLDACAALDRARKGRGT